jgi:sec-independent protein translocase protein TatA
MPSGWEWLFIVAIVLLVFGGSQLPKLARNLGQAQKEFKTAMDEGAREADTPSKETGTPGTPGTPGLPGSTGSSGTT